MDVMKTNAFDSYSKVQKVEAPQMPPIKVGPSGDSGGAKEVTVTQGTANLQFGEASYSESEFTPDKQFLKTVADEFRKENPEFNIKGSYLDISIHDKSRQVIVKIKNADGDVIREIPSEKMVQLAAALIEKAGILVNTKK